MQKAFVSNITQKGLFNKDQRLLLAVSGGIDSIVLAHLLKKTGFQFSMAHCNFKLRGKDSNADEVFCKKAAKALKVKLHSKSFDTKTFAKHHKLSTQMAARKLRYNWFNELLKTEKYDYLLTAHHASDMMETFFINLMRGTGINGLKGIPEKNEQTVRPLLAFTKDQIEAYAKKNKLVFRLDKSNLEDHYERNFIRLNIIPLFKKINPALEEIFIRNTENLRQEAGIVKDYLEEHATDLITQTSNFVFIDKKKLKNQRHPESVLRHILEGYGFNRTQQKSILKTVLANGLSGKLFRSATHTLAVDRNDLVIKPASVSSETTQSIHSFKDLFDHGLFKTKELHEFELPAKNECLVSKKRLIFPLQLRTKQNGDRFMPFGMKNFKLVSDFFKEQKLNHFEKEQCRLLVNGNGEIIWITGHRSDQRYKVKNNETDLLKLTYLG